MSVVCEFSLEKLGIWMNFKADQQMKVYGR